MDLRLIVKSLGPSPRQCLRHLWPLSLQQLERRVGSPSVLPQSRLLHLKALRKHHPTKHPQKRANLLDQHLLHLHHPTIPIRVKLEYQQGCEHKSSSKAAGGGKQTGVPQETHQQGPTDSILDDCTPKFQKWLDALLKRDDVEIDKMVATAKEQPLFKAKITMRMISNLVSMKYWKNM